MRLPHNNSIFLLIGFLIVVSSCKDSNPILSELPEHISIHKATETINIDGKAMETSWSSQAWKALDHIWLGEKPTPTDFQGRYKLSWDSNKFYVLAEIIDDQLVDTHPDGLNRYWDDDCLEVFIDENRSADIHQYNHSAFAYHIALDGKVVDLSTDSIPTYYDHVISKRTTYGNKTIWEVAIDIYDDTYQDGESAKPLKLSADKVMGFALAYCDNDSSVERETFIGSVKVEGKDKNRGWIDAGIFEEVTLK